MEPHLLFLSKAQRLPARIARNVRAALDRNVDGLGRDELGEVETFLARFEDEAEAIQAQAGADVLGALAAVREARTPPAPESASPAASGDAGGQASPAADPEKGGEAPGGGQGDPEKAPAAGEPGTPGQDAAPGAEASGAAASAGG